MTVRHIHEIYLDDDAIDALERGECLEIGLGDDPMTEIRLLKEDVSVMVKLRELAGRRGDG